MRAGRVAQQMLRRKSISFGPLFSPAGAWGFRPYKDQTVLIPVIDTRSGKLPLMDVVQKPT
jgi:hypothetical protein